MIACAGCGARHHVECFREIDRCASCRSVETLTHPNVVKRLQVRYEVVVTVFLFLLLCFTAVTLVVTSANDADSLEHQRILRERRALEQARDDLQAAKLSFREMERSWNDEHARLLEDAFESKKRLAQAESASRKSAREAFTVCPLQHVHPWPGLASREGGK